MVIYENNIDHLNDFIRLNEEWINKYFELEDVDRCLAKNPAKVIEDNGFIFSIVENDIVVGVCALFNEGHGVYELARMAVSPEYQCQGYGDRLLNKCLSKAKEIKATNIYLVSNTKLKAAISLYIKHGFIADSTEQHPLYSRANITMVYNVS